MQTPAATVLVCMVVELAMALPVLLAGIDGWPRQVVRWCVVRLLALAALTPLLVPGLPVAQAFLLSAIGLTVARSLDGQVVSPALADLRAEAAPLVRASTVACRVAQWTPLAVLAAYVLLYSRAPAAAVDVAFGTLILALAEVIFVCLASHLTALVFYRRKAAEARAASFQDALTGAVNRRGLAAAAEREFARAQRTRRPISLMMIDLDGFKGVNDTLGHAEGDMLLERCAAAISTVLRRQDVLCRFGGDEFCILLPETDMDGAAVLAERVRMAVEVAGLGVRRGPRPVTASVGLSCADGEQAHGLEILIERADRALYRAKCEGRNRIARDEDSSPAPRAERDGGVVSPRTASAGRSPLIA